jgi:predicted GH43/DUF377 family glycosyl hydrolase
MKKLFALLIILLVPAYAQAETLSAKINTAATYDSAKITLQRGDTEFSLAGLSVPTTLARSAFNPIFSPTGTGWESARVYSPIILKEDGIYYMWYTGFDDSPISASIGVATSFDGLNWTRYAGNPILQPGTAGTWDDYLVISAGSVINDNGTYKMWYTGNDGTTNKIGYATATSPFGPWTKYASNPVLDLGAGGTWDDYIVAGGQVIKDGSTYKMWYGGHDGAAYRVGYATSSDGISWTKYASNPVLDLGTGGSWDDVIVDMPKVLKKAGTYHMWYRGYDGAYSRIGYASSSDGISWTKYASNPVLTLGTGGAWDDDQVYYHEVINDGDIFKMWYTGTKSSGLVKIGYAVFNTFSFDATAPTIDPVFLVDSGASSAEWNMSSLNIIENQGDETGAITYQYSCDSGSRSYNGSWLTLAQLQSGADPTGQYLAIKATLTSGGTQDASIADSSIDVALPVSTGGSGSRSQIGGKSEVFGD